MGIHRSEAIDTITLSVRLSVCKIENAIRRLLFFRELLRSLIDILFLSEVMLIEEPLMEVCPIILARSADVTDMSRSATVYGTSCSSGLDG